MKSASKFRRFSRLNPRPTAKGTKASRLVADTSQACNAARLREGCELFTQKMLSRNGVDSTIALPLIAAYALDRAKPRKPKRLIDHRDRLLQRVARDDEQSPLHKDCWDR